MTKKITIAFSILGIILLLIFFIKFEDRSSSFRCDDCNVIIISLSNLRKNNLKMYGYEKSTTPNIDSFFKNSIVFENAIAPASLTFTDYISLFFSLQPNRHKFMNRSDREKSGKILSEYYSLPLLLKEAGYKTAAFVSDEDYAYKNNLGSQFDLYFDKRYYPDYQIPYKNWEYGVGTKDLTTPAIKWLKDNYKNKFLLFFQAYDMHCPYTPNEYYRNKYDSPHSKDINFSDCFMTLKEVEKKKKGNKNYFTLYSWKSFLDKKVDKGVQFSEEDVSYLKNLYDAELENADMNLLPLFDTIKKLGLEKNTLVIFMSEHGDYLGEAGFFMKASVLPRGNLHNVNLGFPLVIKSPRIDRQIKYKSIFQAIDFAPTILDMLNLKINKKMQGLSHLKSIGTKKEINDYAYSFCLRKRDYVDEGAFLVESVQNSKWKLDNFEHYDYDGKFIKQEQFLFDLENDKNESKNVVTTNKEIVFQLNKVIKEKRAKYE